jgi:hypothetical protein
MISMFTLLTFRIRYGHDIEEKGLYVIVERLVVQETFGDKAEILAILFVLLSAHLED